MDNSAGELYGRLLITAARLRLVDADREIANKDGAPDAIALGGLIVKAVGCHHVGEELSNGMRPVFKITAGVLTQEEYELIREATVKE